MPEDSAIISLKLWTDFASKGDMEIQDGERRHRQIQRASLLDQRNISLTMSNFHHFIPQIHVTNIHSVAIIYQAVCYL